MLKEPSTPTATLAKNLRCFCPGLKKSISKSQLWYIGVFAGYAACFTLFPIALKTLPLSIAYATWSGVGTAASVLIGAALFSEKLTAVKAVWIGLIVAGVVGLNF